MGYSPIGSIYTRGGTDTGTGSTTFTRPSVLLSGSRVIPAGDIALEDGSGSIANEEDSQGNITREDTSVKKILAEADADGAIADETDGAAIDDEQSVEDEEIEYGLTALVDESTPCDFVIVIGKSTNSLVIKTGNIDCATLGIPLVANASSPEIEIDDLIKVYIYGPVGEGVNFLYGTREEESTGDIENTDETVLENTDETTLENT